MSIDGAKDVPKIKVGAAAPPPGQNDLSWDAMIPGQHLGAAVQIKELCVL